MKRIVKIITISFLLISTAHAGRLDNFLRNSLLYKTFSAETDSGKLTIRLSRNGWRFTENSDSAKGKHYRLIVLSKNGVLKTFLKVYDTDQNLKENRADFKFEVDFDKKCLIQDEDTKLCAR